jgi:hypothetical protein
MDKTQQEHWRDIDGYAGYYQVSNLGRVRALDRDVRVGGGGVRRVIGTILKPQPESKARGGYFVVHLRREGKRYSVRVHRLVLAAWVGPCPAGQEVRHGPNGVTDNSVSNLCYGTSSQNHLDRWRDGTVKDRYARPVRMGKGRRFNDIYKAAKHTGGSVVGIYNCCKGSQYRSGGRRWHFILTDAEKCGMI